MSLLAFELNDAGIVAVREGVPEALAWPESPGYALLDDETIVTGQEACKRSRLKPRFTHTRFWDALDTAPLTRPFPSKLSRADLAHAHLSHLWGLRGKENGHDAVLAVPGWYSLDQLGLILGMARSCGISVNGMMDSALAAAAGVSEGSALVHLDIHLHRISASRILRDEQLVREHTLVDEDVGLVPLQDAWVTLLAQTFVRQTRFDPLHLAPTEQKLYDHLPAWLEALYDEEVAALSMESGGKRHTIDLPRKQVVQAALSYYEPIASLAASAMPSDGPALLLLSHRLAALPGLVEKLSRDISDNVVVLPVTAAAAGALSYEKQAPPRAADEGALTFLTSLHVGNRGQEEDFARSVPASRDGARPPTHLLHDGVAYPLDPEPFFLGVSIPDGKRGLNLTGETSGISRYHCSIYRADVGVVVEDHSKFGSFLNGKRVRDRAPLQAGDRLRLGSPGIELQLIEVSS